MRDITEGQDLIVSFTALMPPKATVHSSRAVVQGVAAPDSVVAQLLEKAQEHYLSDGVWEYAGSPYPSQSEADFALLGEIVREAFKLGLPVENVEDATIRVFEKTGLYRVEKCHRVLTQDIPNLINSHYVNQPLSGQAVLTKDNGPKLGSGRIGLSNTPPPPRDYVHDGLILAGKTCVLAGFGGVSKTMYLMMLAASIALGRDFLDKATKAGCVLLILGEEDQEEIDRRFNAIVHALGLSAAEIHLISERVRAHPMIGLDARFTKHKLGVAETTGFPDEIIQTAKALEVEAGVPIALVGLDHAGLIHGGDFNAREDTVQTMTQVGRVSQETGAATMVLAHSPKGSANSEEPDQNNVTGSAAWVDLARAAYILKTMTKEEAKTFGISGDLRSNYVSFNVVKNNYGPTGEKIWLERFPVPSYSVSILELAKLTKSQAVNSRSSLKTKVKDFIKQRPGEFTITSLRETEGGKDGRFKVGKNLLASTAKDLVHDDELALVDPTEEQRKKHGLRDPKTQVLEAV